MDAAEAEISAWASVLTSNVFASPGTPTRSACPRARSDTSMRSMTSSWPTTRCGDGVVQAPCARSSPSRATRRRPCLRRRPRRRSRCCCSGSPPATLPFGPYVARNEDLCQTPSHHGIGRTALACTFPTHRRASPRRRRRRSSCAPQASVTELGSAHVGVLRDGGGLVLGALLTLLFRLRILRLPARFRSKGD